MHVRDARNPMIYQGSSGSYARARQLYAVAYLIRRTNLRSPKFDKIPAVHTHVITQPYRYLTPHRSSPSPPRNMSTARGEDTLDRSYSNFTEWPGSIGDTMN